MENKKYIENRIQWHKYMGSEHKYQYERILEIIKDIKNAECTEINDAAELQEIVEICESEPEYFSLSANELEEIKTVVNAKIEMYVNQVSVSQITNIFLSAKEEYKGKAEQILELKIKN